MDHKIAKIIILEFSFIIMDFEKKNIYLTELII